MWVYGDHSRRELPDVVLERLMRRCQGLRGAGSARDEATWLLIEAGELVQGALDRLFFAEQADDLGPSFDACRELVTQAGALYGATSAGERDAEASPLEAMEVAITELRRAIPGEPLELRTPEGYAFYALYPEAYLGAAARLPRDGAPWVVLGIRSIGTSLGGVVAAALQTSELFFLRPVGDPFRRTVAVAPALERRILRHPTARYAIVDEGPGLSGSSFGGAADWLEDRGIVRERIHFLAGHAGELGPHASPAHRARWAERPPLHTAFETLYGERRLRGEIFADIDDTGTADIQDISGGRWRAKVYRAGALYPPANPLLERRKFLCRRRRSVGHPMNAPDDESVVAKFVGLGRYGERQLARAVRLHAEGFVPAPLALRSGFLLSRWEDAVPLDAVPERRSLCLEQASRYLAFLAHLPAPLRGASVRALFDMSQTNIGEGIGEASAARFARQWRERLDEIACRCDPVETDNRMHRWEWLVCRDGRVLKADALEHHAAHDLIGCQDLAWDIAGLSSELVLCDEERRALSRGLAAGGCYRADAHKEAYFAQCYAAFQLGYYTMAAKAVGAFDADEAARLHAEVRRYAAELARLLA